MDMIKLYYARQEAANKIEKKTKLTCQI